MRHGGRSHRCSFYPWEPPSLRGVQNGLLSFDEEGQDGEAEALNTD